MKILHINSMANGGAFRAAQRINHALQMSGMESQLLCIGDVLKTSYHQKRNGNSLAYKLRWRLRHHLNLTFSVREKVMLKYNRLRPKLNCEISSVPVVADLMLHDHSLVKEADIIHLHWVASSFDYLNFFNNIKKPVVWTLHDENPVSGIFHYGSDLYRNKLVAEEFDNYIKEFKTKIINAYREPLEIVTPSRWLQKEALNSEIFKDRKVTLIPYPIDLQEFKRSGVDDLRKKYTIAVERPIVLAVADSINITRKGFDLLIKAAAILEDVTFILIGNADMYAAKPDNVIYTGRIESNEQLIQYYSLADVTVIPSREDNLPNVLLESLACGTPVVSFAVGGMTDHIINYQTGRITEEISAEALASIISDFFKNRERFNSKTIRQYAEEHFGEQKIAEQYLRVYNRVTKITSTIEYERISQ